MHNPQKDEESLQTARRTGVEILLVLGLSLGASAVYSIVRILRRLGEETPLAGQSTSLNPSLVPEPWLDALYQLLDIGFSLVPVALALFFLARPAQSGARRIGLVSPRPLRDGLSGVALVLIIGIPGLALYLGGRALGITVQIGTAPEQLMWWNVLLLVLAAVRAGLLEEVIVVGYLFEKLRALGWSTAAILLSTSLLRGSYHLYQGIGPFIGNVAMGLVFGWIYHRTGRVLPLVVAHALIDTIAFVGYPFALAAWPELFG